MIIRSKLQTIERTFRLLILTLGIFITIVPSTLGAHKDCVEPSQPVYDFLIENAWLIMKDGVRLSVTFYKPVSLTPGEKFPVLFDLYPYRKDEYPYDHPLYFVRRGYILASVDIRGTGSSEGMVPPREYSEQELDDAVEIIEQLSELPDSNGRVGMWGKSWGGFNSIQVDLAFANSLLDSEYNAVPAYIFRPVIDICQPITIYEP